MTTPNKETYEQALETVKQFEDRSATIERLNKDLGYELKKFTTFKFREYKDDKEIFFSGVKNTGELVIGRSKRSPLDKKEDVIGKLISVYKAIGKDIDEVVKYVEKEETITINTDGMFINSNDLINGNWIANVKL